MARRPPARRRTAGRPITALPNSARRGSFLAIVLAFVLITAGLPAAGLGASGPIAPSAQDVPAEPGTGADPGAAGAPEAQVDPAVPTAPPPTVTPQPTATIPPPTVTPQPTATTPPPTATPQPTATTVPTTVPTAVPTATTPPAPSATAAPTATPDPTPTARPTEEVPGTPEAAARGDVATLAVETTTVTYSADGISGTWPTTRAFLPSQTLTFSVSAVTGETDWQWFFYSGGSCVGTATTATGARSTLTVPAGAATSSVRVLTYVRDEQVGDSGCLALTARLGTFAIFYTDFPRFVNTTTSDAFSLQILRTSDEIGPQPAGTVNLYLCPSTATPNPANCGPAAGAPVNASVVATTDGTLKSGSIRYAERSHVVTRVTTETSGRYSVPVSLTTSDGVATGTAPTITYTATSNGNTTASNWTTAVLPNQPLTFNAMASTGQSATRWSLHRGSVCSGPSIIAADATGANGLIAGTYSGRARNVDANESILAESACRILTVQVGTPTFTFGNPLAYGGDNVSDTFSITLPKTITTAPVGPPPTGRVDITLCPASAFSATTCQTATGLPVAVSVNLTTPGAAVTGTVTFTQVAHVRYTFVPDGLNRYNSVTTTRSDGVAFTSTTITYTAGGVAGNAVTVPFLPAQAVVFAVSTVTNGNRYSWSLYTGPGCTGPTILATIKLTTSTATTSATNAATGYLSPAAVSARIISTNSTTGARVGDSGCQALTVQRGTPAFTITNRLAYGGDGVSDTFSLTVPRSGTTPTGPQPAGQVQIAFCPAATYDAASCQTATGLTAAGTYTLTAGGTVSGTLAMPKPSYVRYTYVPDTANRYVTGATITSDGLGFTITTLSYAAQGTSGNPWTTPLLPNQNATLSVSAVTGETRYNWYVYGQPNCGGTALASSLNSPIATLTFTFGGPGTYSGRVVTNDANGVRIGDSACQPLTVRIGTPAIVFDDKVAYNGRGGDDTFAVRVVKVSTEVGPEPAGQVRIFLCPTRLYTEETCAGVTGAAVATVSVSGGVATTGTVTMTEPSYVLTRYATATSNRYTVPLNVVTAEFLVDPTPTITITVDPAAVTLGGLTPDCGSLPAGATCVASTDGAVYTYSGAITVTVTTNEVWSGGCGRQPQTSLSETADRLMIRPAGSGGWQNVPIVNGAAAISPGCFGSNPPYTTTTYTFDLAVTVRWTDPAAALGDVIVFQVTAG